MRILYQWIGDISQRIRENYIASDSRSLHIKGRRALFVCCWGWEKLSPVRFRLCRFQNRD